MRIIRIEAIWCSSCLIMKSRMNELVKDKDIEWVNIAYEEADDILKKYNIDGSVLPIYIREDKHTFIIGESSKKEIQEFLKEN